MKPWVGTVCLVAAAAALAAAGAFFARKPPLPPLPVEVAAEQTPDETAVQVNAHRLSFKELDARAVTFMEDDRRMNRKMPANPALAMERYRIMAARTWIYHQILLDVAVAKGIEIDAEEERQARRATERILKKTRGITLEEFYAEGPLSPELKRADARDAQLVRKLIEEEVDPAIRVSDDELSRCMAERKCSRKEALGFLRNRKHNILARRYFRELFPLAQVKSRAYPSLELLDEVSPPRPEDDEE